MDRKRQSVAHDRLAGRDKHGALYLVGTPIGNLQDMSARAREILGRVDVIAAEDTRRTGVLLSSIGVDTPLIAYHEHNERARTGELLGELSAGKSVALVSDAGMPLISDPGFRLVREAIGAGVEVHPIPGPSAVLAALCASGLPTDRFSFEGFLPRRAQARHARLEDLSAESRTMVFFESVHRLRETLDACVDVFGGDRPATLARELTKLHEQMSAGTLEQLAGALGSGIPELGEFVLVVAGAVVHPEQDDPEVQRVFRVLSKALPPRQAVALTAELTELPRNTVYRLTRVR